VIPNKTHVQHLCYWLVNDTCNRIDNNLRVIGLGREVLIADRNPPLTCFGMSIVMLTHRDLEIVGPHNEPSELLYLSANYHAPRQVP
jgi:hypothetical protein